MADDVGHNRSVTRWLERAKALPSHEQLCAAFDHAFQALFRRAHLALGEVTLGAVVERVRYNASERSAVLSALQSDREGLRCDALARNCSSMPVADLADALASMMLEFLTVLGSLTAEILSPALHAELARVTRELAGPGSGASADGPPERSEDEGTES